MNQIVKLSNYDLMWTKESGLHWLVPEPRAILYDGYDVKITRNNKSIIFETAFFTKSFEDLEALEQEPDKYYQTIYNLNVLHKGLYGNTEF